MYDKILKGEERICFSLRSLYKRYGYLPYKMSKFEEYDLYAENKEFLTGEGIITFNDTDGTLMALKPDVTLSILKNDLDGEGKRKVCYDENVYRISARTKRYKEIKQVGLECLGEISLYDVFETVCLAAESLAQISENFVLNLSHFGLVSAIVKSFGGGERFEREVVRALAEKNAHETANLCEKYGVEGAKEKLSLLVSAYGEREKALAKIQPLCESEEALEAYDRLKTLSELLKKSKYSEKIRLDFSVGGDMNYYDDVVFKGFVEGVFEGVLSGGRYDKLLSRMGRSSGGIGFAVYLDVLEGFGEKKERTDVDLFVLYDENTDPLRLIDRIDAEIAKGKSVRAQKSAGNFRYGELLDLTGGKV